MKWGLLLLTSLVAGVTCQYAPSCSFVDNQCMYHVQLGHQGQCDKRQVSAGDGQCCVDLQDRVNEMGQDMEELKSQVSILMSEWLTSKGNLSEVTQHLTEAELRTQQLLDTLSQREAELNTTQHELARVLNNAGDEIRSLRAMVQQLTSDLTTCRASLGLPTNTTALPASAVLGPDVTMTLCDFEDHADSNDTMCGYVQTGSYTWKRGHGTLSSYTGPREDRTYGTPAGHYMYLDGRSNGAHSTSTSSTQTITITSPEYPPALRGYCVRFWYNMYGTDVKSFDMYAKISGAGAGYPVFSSTGAHGQEWHLAEVDLDSEYTARGFHLVFVATSNAYHSTYSSSVYHENADVAFDDVYVYNTSCSNIPLCPNGITRDVSGQTYCYTFHVQPATWYEAAVTCRREGATTGLVAVETRDEQDFLVNTIKSDPALTSAGQYGFFTSGADQRAERTFEWTDRGTPRALTFSNWKTGQPNDVGGAQDCLLLRYPDLDFQWGDEDCSSRHPFICRTVYPTPRSTPHAHNSAAPLVG